MNDQAEKRVLTLLGFAQAAGKVVSGNTGVRTAIERRKARLVVLAGDAAAATKEQFVRLSERMHVPIVALRTDRNALGLAIGKSPRAAVAVLDAQFAQAIQRALDREEK